MALFTYRAGLKDDTEFADIVWTRKGKTVKPTSECQSSFLTAWT
jgi:hypothetical protein